MTASTKADAGRTPASTLLARNHPTVPIGGQRFRQLFRQTSRPTGPEHLRQYQLYLLNERKLSVAFRNRADLRAPLLFHESTSPALPRDRSGLSETSRAITGDSERGGSGAAHRVGQHFLPSRDSHDVVRNGIAPRGTVPIESDRRRQQAHGDSRSSRERATRIAM